jgi:arylformamidase
VVDLTPIAPNEAITAERLAERAAHVWAGDIAVIKSCWEQHRSPKTPEFWTEAPYMRREAAHWLLECAARAVAFDFPPDYSIRLLLRGEVRPLEEQVTHDVLLRNGVILIE